MPGLELGTEDRNTHELGLNFSILRGYGCGAGDPKCYTLVTTISIPWEPVRTADSQNQDLHLNTPAPR